jgi:hypothetical protein
VPTACIVLQGREFRQSAGAVEAFLKGRRFTTTKFDLDDSGIGVSGAEGRTFDTLPSGCDVSVWLSHGGWDGPMVLSGYQQVDPTDNPSHWPALTTALQRHVRANGLFVIHACHSAGSNRWESTSGSLGERWVQQVAEGTQRYAVGVEGSTASANGNHAVALLKFALDGTRWLQASRAYAPGGARVLDWRGWSGIGDARR